MRLRHRLDDAAADLVVLATREELAEKPHVLGVTMRLAEPEDGLGPGVAGFPLVGGDAAKGRIRALVVRLGEGKDRLAKDVLVGGVRGGGVERGDRAGRVYLAQPLDGFGAHLFARILA